MWVMGMDGAARGGKNLVEVYGISTSASSTPLSPRAARHVLFVCSYPSRDLYSEVVLWMAGVYHVETTHVVKKREQ